MSIIYNSRFCKDCKNLMIINTDPENGISSFKCRICKGTVTINSASGNTSDKINRIVVLVKNYGTYDVNTEIDSTNNYEDPTLPQIQMKCPYACGSTVAKYQRINAKNLVYQYTCENKHSWTNKNYKEKLIKSKDGVSSK